MNSSLTKRRHLALRTVAFVLLAWVTWSAVTTAVDMSGRRETSEVYRLITDAQFRAIQAALVAVAVVAGGSAVLLAFKVSRLLFRRSKSQP